VKANAGIFVQVVYGRNRRDQVKRMRRGIITLNRFGGQRDVLQSKALYVIGEFRSCVTILTSCLRLQSNDGFSASETEKTAYQFTSSSDFQNFFAFNIRITEDFLEMTDTPAHTCRRHIQLRRQNAVVKIPGIREHTLLFSLTCLPGYASCWP